MNIYDVKKVVDGTPHMTLPQAEKMTRFIQEHDIRDILELGFSQGVSTCYMAAALDESGGGRITTIDLEYVREANPNIDSLLARLGLRNYVDVFFEPTSYTWRLMKMLEEDPSPKFDFCYLDGAHSWFVDGFAFFLVDRLLRPGGWIILDDLDWTYDSSPTLKSTETVRAMPSEERKTPHIRKVYELLVRPHPFYGNFRIEDDWAYAHKLPDSSSFRPSALVAKEVIVQKEHIGLGAFFLAIFKRIGIRKAKLVAKLSRSCNLE